MNLSNTKKGWMAVLAVIAGLGLPASASAEAGDWLARLRVIQVNPDEKSSLPIGVSNETTLDLDFSYFLTRNLALELVLAYRGFDVSLSGANIGNVKLLPPTLTLQYHFLPQGTFRPYVGAGVNYTRFSNRGLAGGTLEVGKDSFGGALGAGFDFDLSKNFFLNVDVKKVWIGTDVKAKATGATVTKLDIDPWIFGVGVGLRF